MVFALLRRRRRGDQRVAGIGRHLRPLRRGARPQRINGYRVSTPALFDKHLEPWATCWRSGSREAPRVLRVRRLDIQLTRSLLRAPSAASLAIGLTRLGALSFVLLQTAGLHLD